jgi:ribonuclease HI
MILLNTAHKIERALQVYVRNAAGLRQAKKAAILLFHSRKPGWRRAQRLWGRAQQLLERLRNRSVAWVVQSDHHI